MSSAKMVNWKIQHYAITNLWYSNWREPDTHNW